MLKHEENERVTRVGPGTPMGEVMRRYWQPILLSTELPEPDCPPIRVRILGEDLIAFRDTNGDVGLVDAFCPHRRAPMFFGRNEECGLRCVYHGWKFDKNGTCVDMPSEPPDSLFKTKVRITAYPTYEAAGVVFTYMGPAEKQPANPDFEWMRAPDTHRFVSKTFEDANWLQALEGGIDSSHSSFAHNERLGDKQNWVRNKDTAPRLDVEKTAYGFNYSSVRDVGDEGWYVRVYHYVMPGVQMRGSITAMEGGRAKVPKFDGHVWVPIDDEHTMVYNMLWAYDNNVPMTPEYIEQWEIFNGRGPDDQLAGFKPKRNLANDYLIDRERQKTKTFTGIIGVNTQDMALQEGMGPICDRTKEHLGTSDKAIIAARQLLLEACEDVAAGKDPRGTNPVDYRNVRPYDDYVPRDQTWKEAWANELTAKW
ncbi:MAG: Rieske 2Fe-2S domain-containing protein [Candidatus Eremiobacteraeota bacterium]|nr:Rieske 2Fe-2S domain-containing protein [Candidatus Eremiobacteraeota bacterium]